jgi:hypothetical protein
MGEVHVQYKDILIEYKTPQMLLLSSFHSITKFPLLLKYLQGFMFLHFSLME